MLSTEECQNILAAIVIAFPSYKPTNMQMAVDMYKSMFADYTYEQVSHGLQTYIATDTSGFAPSIGQIIDKIRMPEAHNELSEMVAWDMVRKALSNSTYGSEKEFEKLPDEVQRAVGSPSQLRAWATDEHFNDSVVSSNFMRTYRELCKRSREEAKIPNAIKIAMKEGVLIGKTEIEG